MVLNVLDALLSGLSATPKTKIPILCLLMSVNRETRERAQLVLKKCFGIASWKMLKDEINENNLMVSVSNEIQLDDGKHGDWSRNAFLLVNFSERENVK